MPPIFFLTATAAFDREYRQSKLINIGGHMIEVVLSLNMLSGAYSSRCLLGAIKLWVESPLNIALQLLHGRVLCKQCSLVLVWSCWKGWSNSSNSRLNLSIAELKLKGSRRIVAEKMLSHYVLAPSPTFDVILD